MKMMNFLRALLPFFWGNDRHINNLTLLGIGFGLLTVILNLCVPLSLRYSLNYMTDSTQQPVMLALLIVGSYGLIWTFAQMAQTLRYVLLFKPMNRSSRNIAQRFFQHVLSLPMSFHLNRRTGELLANVKQAQNSLPTLINAILWQIVPIVLEVVFAIAITCWLYGAVYGLMIFLTLFCYTVATVLSMNNAVKLQNDHVEKSKLASAYIHDTLINYETIKYFNNDAVESAQYDVLLADKEVAHTRIDTKMFLINMLQMVIIGIGITCITTYAGYSILHRHLTVGDFVLLNGYVLQFSVPLSYFGYLIRELKQAYFDLRSTLEVLNTPSNLKDSAAATPLALNKANIVFDNVSFGYNDQRDIIKNISFEVPHGKTLAIVGPTGSGKSTISKLLYRFFDTTDGAISINNQTLKSVTLDSLQRSIGIVPQEAVLFNNTLRYNIAYGNRSASEMEIWHAVKMAGLASFVERLPMGLDTLVGERGVKISGGEKQRVAIARMLLKQPAIYIFDEATSSLDVEMEQQIQKNIEKVSKGVTTIVIAHRLSTVRYADQIIVLDKGKIIECGSHDSLLSQKGYYNDMYHRQVLHSPVVLSITG